MLLQYFFTFAAMKRNENFASKPHHCKDSRQFKRRFLDLIATKFSLLHLFDSSLLQYASAELQIIYANIRV